MNSFCRFFRYMCAIFIITVAAVAHADIFDFQVQGTQVNGSGTLTAVPDPSLSGVFDITSISGTLAGETIVGLLPCSAYSPSSPCTDNNLTFGYDNLLYPGGLPPFNIVELDGRGLGIQLPDNAVDISASSSHQDTFTYNGEVGAVTPIIVSFTVSPTPEPGSFVLLGTGILAMALACRRLRKMNSGVLTAIA